MNNKTIQQQQEQELIPQELIQKFDGDKELVTEFLEQGYTQEELMKSSVLHPTKMDPLCVLENGQNAGMWLYADNDDDTNENIEYSSSTYDEHLKRSRTSLYSIS